MTNQDMTSEELENEIMLLINCYREMTTAKHPNHRQIAQQTAEASFTKLAIQLIVDFHSLAQSLESIAISASEISATEARRR